MGGTSRNSRRKKNSLRSAAKHHSLDMVWVLHLPFVFLKLLMLPTTTSCHGYYTRTAAVLRNIPPLLTFSFSYHELISILTATIEHCRKQRE
jgi:hypothetical protein